MSKRKHQHPGEFIKSNVLPEGMKVTEAAKRLDIGRPALSNMLHGKASLSPELAAKLEHVFGANAHELMDMQAAYDTEEAGLKSVPAPYAPPFLQIKANAIEDWADKEIPARNRLPVLLRTLVNSTGFRLTRCEFHGNDDSQRPGHDGYVEAEGATAWIPEGKSWWEFGVNDPVKGKADGDYVKSCDQLPLSERLETTFVFVTPRRWHGKAAWEKTRRDEKKWKSVRVLDASDLEQWLEQSIPAQAWFANELKLDSEGVKSLDACWIDWKADCNPVPDAAFFQSTIDALHSKKKGLLLEPEQPFRLAADSVVEALAFLSCLFSEADEALFPLRDKVIVFEKAGVLSRLAKNLPHFIAVITSPEVEKEYARLEKKPRAIVIYPRNVTTSDPDLALEPLSYDSFQEAFKAIGVSGDQIDRLSNESGRSLTVLRRRLSSTPSIQVPEWAQNKELVNQIIPFFFAGAWNKSNHNDTAVLELLSQEKKYDDLEKDIRNLHRTEDSPVWLGGDFRGLVSKIDVLFAIAGWITGAQVKTFLEVAEMVLAEDDPSLDLPEADQWAAHIYGKKRELSAALRKGVSETLVLLSVYGNQLLKPHVGFDITQEVEMVIKKLLTPMEERRLISQSDEFPMYAEAAPNMFLNILEDDLGSENPQIFSLLKPVNSSLFGRCYRSGLLWGLESLAWSKEYFMRSVRVLSQLSEPHIDDNYVNKPSNSLSAIFRCWMPQTSVSIEERIAALKHLADQYPEVAWQLCKEQFDAHSTIGHYSNKPKWRTDGQGFGEPVTNKERWQFARASLDLAINWKSHSKETLGDLVESLRHLIAKDQMAIWDLIESWARDVSEEDRSWMREKVRTHTLSRRAKLQKNDKDKDAKDRAKEIYELLTPHDVVLKHDWLFLNSWVEESADELEDEEYDYKKRDERIGSLRKNAIKEVLAEKGIVGIMELAVRGDASHVIGFYLKEIFDDRENLISCIKTVLEAGGEDDVWQKSLVRGILSSHDSESLREILPMLGNELTREALKSVLLLCPFNCASWYFVRSIGNDFSCDYWRNVTPSWGGQEDRELEEAANELLRVGRPAAAFEFVRLDLSKIQPRTLFRVLENIGNIPSEYDSSHQLTSHSIRKALEVLNNSAEISTDEMAALEFKFIGALDREDGGAIPNLESRVEKNPELFVQAIVFSFKRRDGKEDPKELQPQSEEHLSSRANSAYKFLSALRTIPGRDRYGELTTENIIAWINQVREGCKELGREEMGDQTIGSLFAHAPKGQDDIWPCAPVRDALEAVMTEQISRGLHTGLYNSRGVHWRGEGGDQEREIAAKYRKWADAVEYSHPKLHKLLMSMVETYSWEAEKMDDDAVVNKRLRDF